VKSVDDARSEAERTMNGGRPLRIAMIAACPFPSPRGTPIRIFRMAEALAHLGHEVHVATYHLGDATGPLPFQIHRIPHVRFYRRSDPGPTYGKLLVLDPLLGQALRRLMRTADFDVIHAHHYEGLLVAKSLPSRGRPPIIYDAHTLLETELPFYRMGLGRRMLSSMGRILDYRLPGSAAHVITVTEELRDRLLGSNAVPADRITVVENGVEADLFDVPPAERHTQDPTIVFAGNLAAYQGVDLLFEAFGLVVRKRADVRLKVLTDSGLGRLGALAESLGILPNMDVIHVGFDQLPAQLRAADIAVNPRVECDGVPQKLMNYMAAGRPTVSFAGSAAHMRHGETGWVVESGDVNALAEGILHLIDNPELATGLGKAARELIVREYSWERTARRTEAIYDQVLGAPRAGA